MRNKLTLILAALLALGTFANAQTVVPLNTGYDHSPLVQNMYPAVTTPTSTTRDDYWINIASYPTTTPAVASTFVIRPAGVWAPALPNTNWISARNSSLSAPGTTAANPAYTIFRKCFCLQKGFSKAYLKFNARADDLFSVWFNTIGNVVLAPQTPGNWNGPVRSGATEKGFKVGKNCLYALVEDYTGNMGFNLAGIVSAYGLFQTPAKGPQGSFEPCTCSEPGPAGGARRMIRIEDDDDEQVVIKQLIKIADTRRLEKLDPSLRKN